MQTKVVAIELHAPAGKVKIDPADVLAMTLQPYPVIVMKPDSDGKFKRWCNFPIEFTDEQTHVVTGVKLTGLDGLPGPDAGSRKG